MNKFDVFHWVKDKSLRFLSCSEGVAELAGVDSPYQMIGKTDDDFMWSNRSQFYRKEEDIALSGRELQQIQTQKTVKGVINIFVTKSPLYNLSRKIVGTVGSSIDISHYFITKKDIKIVDSGALIRQKYYLTKREVEVLKLLLYGYTNKLVATQLHISIRTVESHVDAIKQKLGCQHKHQILKQAILSGLLFAYNELSNISWAS